MAEREILEFSGPRTTSCEQCPSYWYVEGNSPVVDEVEGGGNWFCFEEPYDKAVSELRKLGFTNEEIEEAKSDV